MSLLPNLPGELELRLHKEAERQGLSTDAVILKVLDEHLPRTETGPTPSPWDKLSFALATQHISLSDSEGVSRYLDCHADLFDVVAQIARATRSEFGADAAVTLSLYRDPEIVDDYLVLTVRLPSYPNNLLERLRAVTDPFDDQLSGSSGTILVTSDFRPKR